jgi:ribokinase
MVLAQLEVPTATVAEAFRLGREAGAVTVLNAAPALVEIPDAVWANTDFLIVNETEARQLTGKTTEDDQALCALLASRVRLGAVITLGALGAIGKVAGGELIKVPAPSIELVDSTGAGDAFVGAFCTGWLRTRDLFASMQLGTAAGSLACTTRGAVSPQANTTETALDS